MVDGLIRKEAKSFLFKSRAEFKKFEEDWGLFAFKTERDASKEMVTIVHENVSSSVNALGITYTVDVNVDDKRKQFLKYVDLCLRTRELKMLNFFTDCDENLQDFQDGGVEANQLQEIISVMEEWIDFCKWQQFRLDADTVVRPVINSKCIDIYNKWKNIAQQYRKESESQKYGVSIEMLETHKAYLDVKSKMNSATSSKMLRRVLREIVALNGYLDSEMLIAECNSKIEEFRKKELNDRRIQKEKLRKRVAEYENKLAEVSKAREEFISKQTAEITQEYDKKIAEIESDYEQAISENENSLESATADKIRIVKELETAGVLAVFKKMSLRSQLESAEENINNLKKEKRNLTSKYKKSQKVAKTSYDSSIEKMNKTADEKYKLPKDPRKNS